MKKLLLIFVICTGLLFINIANAQNLKKAAKTLLSDTAVQTGHMGIYIYNLTDNKVVFEHNAKQNFIPASNVKILSLFAALHFLGDSLQGIRYTQDADNIYLQATGDPTFLREDFSKQPVLNFLKHQHKNILLTKSNFKTNALGYGWAWDDFSGDYMNERNPWPIYGNLATFTQKNYNLTATPNYFTNMVQALDSFYPKFYLDRNWENNFFFRIASADTFKSQALAFKTFGNTTTINILKANHGLNITETNATPLSFTNTIYSQKTNQMLKIMMHESDNFFAEQILQMASQQHFGYFNEEKIIDSLTNTEFKNLPQKLQWVDGSGLSRYNLASPQSMATVLQKIYTKIGLDSVKTIFATGGQGTLRRYYKHMQGRIFAKTGTLSNNCALSGFIVGKNGKLYIFSVLNNNYITSATPIRKAVEQFLSNL
jgi:serine-type D-Ala-D-Ala carboxypeptidase/endopeptidase (penicillin-binding protein 4)